MSISEKREQVSANNTAIKENVQKVYEAGKKAEHDAFWDVYQDHGNRTLYRHAFSDKSFNFYNFYPKYDIAPTASAENMFYNWPNDDDNVRFSLAERLEECGVTLDISKVTSGNNIFAWTRSIDDFPTLDFTGMTSGSTLTNTFNSAAATTIRKIIVKEDLSYNGFFNTCTNLTNVTFEGVIGGSGLSFNSSKSLSIASMKSVISCLKDLRGTTGEGSHTIKFDSTCWARLEEDSAAPDGGTWSDYVTSLGWVI